MVLLIFRVCLIVLLGVCAVGSAQETVDDGDDIEIRTDLVSLPVVVRGANNQIVPNLKQSDFRIYEDGRAQTVTNFATLETPFEVALVLDTSNSTRADIGLIRRAAFAFIAQLRPDDKVAIVSFATRQTNREKYAVAEILQPLTSDRAALEKAIERLETSAGTPLYDALEKIGQTIFKSDADGNLRGRQAVVALTDGVDSASEAEFDEAASAILNRNVLTYFVQINTETYVEDKLMQDCADDGRLSLSRAQMQRYRRIFAPQADAGDFINFCALGAFQRMSISRSLYTLARREMNSLARATGGKTFEAFDLRDARRAFSLVAQEIGTQYSLGYYSTNKARNGAYRRLKVEVPKLKGARIETRAGYTAPSGK